MFWMLFENRQGENTQFSKQEEKHSHYHHVMPEPCWCVEERHAESISNSVPHRPLSLAMCTCVEAMFCPFFSVSIPEHTHICRSGETLADILVRGTNRSCRQGGKTVTNMETRWDRRESHIWKWGKMSQICRQALFFCFAKSSWEF